MQPLHFLSYPSILACLIYHPCHFILALHLLLPLHSRSYSPLNSCYPINWNAIAYQLPNGLNAGVHGFCSYVYTK